MIKYTWQAFANFSDPVDNNQTIIPKKVNVYALLISTFWKCKQFFQLAGSTAYTLGSPLRPIVTGFLETLSLQVFFAFGLWIDKIQGQGHEVKFLSHL